MKVLSTAGLTKLIELIKSSFISVDDTETTTEIDTETTSEVTLATVATSGSYNDLTDKPTIPTAGTGIDITNDIISVEGVKDQRNTSTAIKTWTGTRAQYEAIVSKDSNTLYNITDDTNTTLTLLEALYPVGSVYITTASTCPLSALISGSTWQLVSSGRVLQGADSGHSAGTTIEAGLPNITGSFDRPNAYGVGPVSGAFTQGASVGGYSRAITSTDSSYVDFDASQSNAIYGNSDTVQPPAYVVNIFRRTL